MTCSVSTIVTCTQGSRKSMEDYYSVTKLLKDRSHFFAVFDGHGGSAVAAYCKEHMHGVLESAFTRNTSPETDVKIRNAFLRMDALIQKDMPEESQHTGTTVGILFIDKKKIWSANCGDTEIMVSFKDGRSTMLSQSHKVENEIDRLQKKGAIITNYDCPRIEFRLNIARSLGDFDLKKYVIPDPFIKSIPLDKKIDYIIIASDGLWDVFTKDEVTYLIKELKSTTYAHTNYDEKKIMNKICHDVIQEALKKGSTDNITMIFLRIE